MAREGKITAYLMSGVQRHTYKFRRSEVIRDIEMLRQRFSAAGGNNPATVS
jgi:hypothetical protein